MGRLKWQRQLGLLRSLAIYWRPGRQRGLRRLYAPFVQAGDLVFDIGAHVGDRSVAFASLGAQVVAIEPQPHVRRILAWLIEGKPVTVYGDAVGAEAGSAVLAVSEWHPTVSSLSASWRGTVARDNAGFRTVDWDDTESVTVVTLDRLIAIHGLPAFCKIDVEGYEAEVLAGLSSAVPALSFEFVAGALSEARRCVHLLSTLGDYCYNATAGEGRSWLFAGWQEPASIEAWLAEGAAGLASGDVYARLERRFDDVFAGHS